ncbi:MAG: tRNA pseudouridine(13) synthase TruD [archaeon]
MNDLKTVPEDFIVEELPNLPFAEEGSYAVLKLTKTGLTTEDALEKLTRLLHKSRSDFSAAGNKDKHATTTQYVSVKHVQRNTIENAMTKLVPDKLTFSLAGFLDRPLSTGMLAANRFTVSIRNCTGISSLPFMINYFDDQRFSKDNVAIGMLLLKKKFKEAVQHISWHEVQSYLIMHPTDAVGALQKIPPRILTMYVHAVQSLLWNEVVSSIIEKSKHRSIHYSQGSLAIPLEVIGDRSIPLVGIGTDVTLYTGVLEKHNLVQGDFLIRQLPHLTSTGGERQLLAEVKDFTARWEGSTCILSFTLPKGSYATMLIKQLLT